MAAACSRARSRDIGDEGKSGAHIRRLCVRVQAQRRSGCHALDCSKQPSLQLIGQASSAQACHRQQVTHLSAGARHSVYCNKEPNLKRIKQNRSSRGCRSPSQSAAPP